MINCLVIFTLAGTRSNELNLQNGQGLGNELQQAE